MWRVSVRWVTDARAARCSSAGSAVYGLTAVRNRLAVSPVRAGVLRLLQRLSSGHDVDDDVGLGVGVVLDIPPAARREVPLGSFVQGTVGLVNAEVLAEADHRVDLRAARAEHVQV